MIRGGLFTRFFWKTVFAKPMPVGATGRGVLPSSWAGPRRSHLRLCTFSLHGQTEFPYHTCPFVVGERASRRALWVCLRAHF